MKTRIQNGKEYIFDIVRKKYIINQPEEWVRQNIIQYLNKEKGYPISLMSIEKKHKTNNKKKRCDIICNDKNGNPLLLIECKAMEIQISAETFNQIIDYQNKIKAQYLIVTNGKKHYCFKIINETIKFLKKIPAYQDVE